MRSHRGVHREPHLRSLVVRGKEDEPRLRSPRRHQDDQRFRLRVPRRLFHCPHRRHRYQRVVIHRPRHIEGSGGFVYRRAAHAERSPMRRTAIGLSVVATATGALVLTSGLAWASWTVGSAPGTVTAKAAQVRVMRAPRREIAGGSPTTSWTCISPRLADHYVVIRSDGATRVTAC